MARYRVIIATSAAKEIERPPKVTRRLIVMRISALAENPRPPGSTKLSGHQAHRVRQGDYRIVYAIDDEAQIVDMIKVGHRRNVYR